MSHLNFLSFRKESVDQIHFVSDTGRALVIHTLEAQLLILWHSRVRVDSFFSQSGRAPNS